MRNYKSFILALFFIGTTARSIPFEGHKILISGPSPYAVEVGKKIHTMGGNVVDVAVAIGLTLSVTTPYYAGLGGGGFALVRMNNEVPMALDFREVAPLGTSKDYFTSDRNRSSQVGGPAVGVPGNPMGLYDLHKKYGKLKWETLFAAPIKLADEGFQLSGDWVNLTTKTKDKFNPTGLKTFFKKDGAPYLPGELLKQPQLAKALKAFRDQGPKGFYSGVVAHDLVQSVQKTGGVLSLQDLKTYKTRWLKPLQTEFKGHKIYLMPPPSSGGVVIAQALSLIESLKLEQYPFLSVNELHLLTEIHSRAYRGRLLLGDPDFHTNPIDKLLSKKELDQLGKSISMRKTTTLPEIDEAKYNESNESSETTHFTVMDTQGNTVTLTTTLNGNYGSGVVSDRFGIALNNEMDDFTARPGEANMFGLIQGKGNLVEPGKRPLSSMSPTIVMKDNQVVMALGAPGGPRIISAVLQVIYRVIGQNLDLDLAVQAPRVYHQFLPNTLYVDRSRLSPDVLDALKKKGHKIEESWIAKVYAVQRNEKGLLKAAFDGRGEGAAGGF